MNRIFDFSKPRLNVTLIISVECQGIITIGSSGMPNFRQSLSLAVLRISLGLLLFWWGLSKILIPSGGTKISDKFYSGLFSNDEIQFYFGFLQVIIGMCVILGLFKKFAVPAQLIITGGSSLAIWNALIDPFGLFLPVAKVASIQHLFYPSAIALAAAAVMIAMREFDHFSLDQWLARRKNNTTSPIAPAE